MSDGYVHTLDSLRTLITDLLSSDAKDHGHTQVAIIGQVGLLLAERLEAIVNVLEDMEKTL